MGSITGIDSAKIKDVAFEQKNYQGFHILTMIGSLSK
jgi:hypothetical protein